MPIAPTGHLSDLNGIDSKTAPASLVNSGGLRVSITKGAGASLQKRPFVVMLPRHNGGEAHEFLVSKLQSSQTRKRVRH